MYQYEPYLKDPVGFPTVMVSACEHVDGVFLGLSLTDAPPPSPLLVDAGGFVLRPPSADLLPLRPEGPRVQLDAGLDPVPGGGLGPGNCWVMVCQ